MLSRESVADLQAGDVVELHGQDATLSGTLIPYKGGLYLSTYCCVRDAAGNGFQAADSIVVLSRAPRPIYVNSTRTAPLAGDVSRNGTDLADSRTWAYTGSAWAQTSNGAAPGADFPAQLRLLVDGVTGRIAPQ